MIRVAVGEAAWEALPAMARELFTANGPAIVAEFNGGESGLDEATLSAIEQPTLLVSASDSPEPFRRVGERLAAALPNSEEVRVEGGHLIDPAHPAIIRFIERIAAVERGTSPSPRV
jgi:pimeloyl-ACP methyl ester carboxylesterase